MATESKTLAEVRVGDTVAVIEREGADLIYDFVRCATVDKRTPKRITVNGIEYKLDGTPVYRGRTRIRLATSDENLSASGEDHPKQALDEIKTGDELILNGPSGSKRVVGVGRTPKQIVAGNRRFDLDGAQIGGDRGHWLSRPQPGQIEKLKREEAQKRDEARQAEAKRRQEESTPEELAADYLTGLGAYTADELLRRCDPKVLIRAANILRRSLK